MIKLNVAVTGAKGGRGIAIMKALLSSPTLEGLGLRVYPIDITPFAAGLYGRTGTEATVLPKPETDPQAWERFVEEKQITVMFPGSDNDLVPLAQCRDYWLAQYNCHVMVSDMEAVKIANDKGQTWESLSTCDVQLPASQLTDSIHFPWYHYPCIIKPRFGANSRGIHITKDGYEMRFFVQHTPDPIVQEYIEGDEYSGAITYDKQGEAQVFFVTRVYERHGHMTFGEVGHYPQIEAFLREFAEKTRLLGFSHALNVQMIEREGVVYVIELNACCSGSTAIRSHFGFNQPTQLILNHVHSMPFENINKLAESERKTGLAMTFTEEMFFDGVTREQLEQSTNGIHGSIQQWL